MCPSLIQIGSKTAKKNSAQTNRQKNRHYENNGHLAVNQLQMFCNVTHYIMSQKMFTFLFFWQFSQKSTDMNNFQYSIQIIMHHKLKNTQYFPDTWYDSTQLLSDGREFIAATIPCSVLRQWVDINRKHLADKCYQRSLLMWTTRQNSCNTPTDRIQ